MQKDAVHIIGAGVIGLSVARECLAAGQAVVIWERGEPGREASWAGGGILSPLYPWRYPAAIDALAAVSQGVYPQLCDALRAATGIDPEYERSGLLILDCAERRAALAWADGYGPRMHVLAEEWMQLADGPRCRLLQPGLGEEYDSGFWLPAVAQVRNPRFVRALLQDLVQSGAELRRDSAVNDIETGDGRVTGLVSGGTRHACSRCVISAGAWSGTLARMTGIALPVAPVRGQMLCLRSEPGLVRRIVLGPGGYLVPRRDGRILAGSTVEHCGFDTATTESARRQLRQMAVRLVPALAGAEIEAHWAGLRPGSPDDVPYIGAHPDVAGLYICAGHYRNGIVTAPASARLLVDLMLQRQPEIDPHPYRLDRQPPPAQGPAGDVAGAER